MKRTYRYYLSRIYREVPLFLNISEKIGHDLTPKKWVFIVGCYNSGTTLLNQILSCHPDILTLPDEGAFLTRRVPTPEGLICQEELHLAIRFKIKVYLTPIALKKVGQYGCLKNIKTNLFLKNQ